MLLANYSKITVYGIPFLGVEELAYRFMEGKPKEGVYVGGEREAYPCCDISSPIVKESIINNSDCKILLDQRKYLNKFDSIQNLLGLTDKERSQVLSINLANHPNRKYKEVWIGLGGTQSAVYATEVSLEEYFTYTTEETEKMELFALSEKLGGNLELAIKRLAESKRNPEK